MCPLQAIALEEERIGSLGRKKVSSIEGAAEGRSLVDGLPRTAIQALYHALTGKTENMSKWLSGNVVITYDSVKSLYSMICEQIQHYDILAKETVTIVVTDSEDRKVTYSSWERFEALQAQSLKVTSDISMKIEFVAKLPNTDKPQRCVINIMLDSSLPVVDSHRKEASFDPPFEFFLFMANDWRTVNVSIDFVDFLLAKNFLSIVEEWFKNFDKTGFSKINKILIKYNRIITSATFQSGRIGAALFLLTYYVLTRAQPDTKTLIILSGIALVIWSLLVVITSEVDRVTRRRVAKAIVPTVILISEIDQKTYQGILDDSRTATGTLARFLGSNIFAILINIIASYIFVRIHG